MGRRTNTSLLALVAMGLATLAFAIPASSGVGNTTLTLDADSPVYYGQSQTLTGSLTYGGVGLEDRSIQITDCASEVATGDTGSGGIYNIEPPAPTAVGTVSYQANFAGDTVGETVYDPASSGCVQVSVDQAPTETSVTNTPQTTLTLGETLSVDYQVFSWWGVSGNTTGGTVSIEETDGLGTLGCGSSDPLSVEQNPGLSAAGTLSCTPTEAGEYSYRVVYSGDDNYQGSDSSYNTSDRLVTVTAMQDQATLSVTGPESATFAAPDVAITTQGGSGTGAITFAAGSSTACSIVDGNLHVTAATGTCSITATKAGDATYNPTTSAAYAVSIDNSYAGTPGTKTCVKDTLRGEETEHGSLKTAATAHSFANTTGLRKDITTYCKTPT